MCEGELLLNWGRYRRFRPAVQTWLRVVGLSSTSFAFARAIWSEERSIPQTIYSHY